VPVFAAILRVPFAIIGPMIVVVCFIGAYTVSASKTDLLLVVLFGIAGYAFKKLDYPIAPLVLAMVLGDKAEDAFRQSMIMSKGSLAIFWSNPLVTTLTVLGLLLLCWPAIAATSRRARGGGRSADAVENRGSDGGERQEIA
jgi:TctA family transporter